MKALVLGGVRSGKSRHAGELALATQCAVTLIVTGAALDAEMAARIDAHRRARPASWRIIEEPLQLAAALRATADPECCIIIDCLTLWLTNVLCDSPDAVSHRVTELVAAVEAAPGHCLLVANEVGLGIMPTNALARRFADEAGMLHQRLAAVCDTVRLMVAGLPLRVKPAAEAPHAP